MPPRRRKPVETAISDEIDDNDSGEVEKMKVDDENEERLVEKKDLVPSYIIEVSKSGRAECRKCNEKIAKGILRIGVITEGDWGLLTRWQHLECTIFHNSVANAENIDGYRELSEEFREMLQSRLIACADKIDDDNIPLDPTELVRKEWSQMRDPPPQLLVPLLPYQKEGLGWMVNQENSSVKGGILADEMGMGKTIQAISLILDNKRNDSDVLQSERWKLSDEEHESSQDLLRGGTLIVLPTIAIRQWQMEIAKFTELNSLSVYVYHGGDRGDVQLKELSNYDVILTSYKILEIEYRKATAGTKVTCRICNKKFYPEKLRVHRKYFCGEHAQKTEAQSKTDKKSSKLKKNEQSDDESSVDSIQKQKIAIKKATKSITVKRKKEKPISSESESDSSNDDISRQKKRVKTSKASTPSKAIKKVSQSKASSRKSSAKTIVDSDDMYESEDFESSSEDSIVSPKKFSKRNKLTSSNSTHRRNNKSNHVDESLVEDEPKIMSKNRKSSKSKVVEVNPVMDTVMREVEEDIQLAIQQAMKSKKFKTTVSSLHLISWFRVILDEAHLIKDRSTSTAKAIFNLVSLYKWCLTGTPLQNRVGELYSLVRFLRIDPHAYYYCRAASCPCRSLHYRFTQGKCDDCQHSSMQHFSHFNKHILNPIKRSGFINEGKMAMLKLKEQLLDEILLRRTKTTRADDIQLPPRIVRVQYAELDEKEDDFYQALYTQSQAVFNTYVTAGTVLNNYAHIFDILIKLRQAVDHPYLVIHSDTKNSAVEEVLGDTETETTMGASTDVVSTLCGICHEPILEDQIIVNECGDAFCRECILEYTFSWNEDTSAKSKLPSCPVCCKPLTMDLEGNSCKLESKHVRLSKRSIMDKVDLERFQSSSKIEALMHEIDLLRRNDPGSKAIVFSQFVKMLDVMEYRLQLGGFKCVKLLGNMSLDQRDKAIRSFKEDPSINVLFISLKAGGVALNLTVANHIFIMDPWWNPAAEMQAIDRTHRIGQTKPIFATRFIIENTIEERILRLQEKKRLVFDGTIGGDSSSMAKLTVDDMRFLFQ